MNKKIKEITDRLTNKSIVKKPQTKKEVTARLMKAVSSGSKTHEDVKRTTTFEVTKKRKPRKHYV